MVETIWIRCATPDGTVCLWDRHPDHPGGEVFVAGETAAEAAETPAVVTALGKGTIVKTSKPKQQAQPTEPNVTAGPQPSDTTAPTDTKVPAGEAGSAAPQGADNDIATTLGDATAEQLAAAGFGSPVALTSANDQQLLEVPGIGEAKLKTIREHYPFTAVD